MSVLQRVKVQKLFLFDGWLFQLLSCPQCEMACDCSCQGLFGLQREIKPEKYKQKA